MFPHGFWQATERGSSGKANPHTGLRSLEDTPTDNLRASTFASPCEVMLEREPCRCNGLYSKARTLRFPGRSEMIITSNEKCIQLCTQGCTPRLCAMNLLRGPSHPHDRPPPPLSYPSKWDIEDQPSDFLQDYTISPTSGRDWRKFFEERYGTGHQMSEFGLIDESAQIWVPIHTAKNEHVTELPVMGLVLVMSYLNVYVILTRVRCRGC